MNDVTIGYNSSFNSNDTPDTFKDISAVNTYIDSNIPKTTNDILPVFVM